ncbi:gamma-glutamylcyclotransferase [Salinarimonas soli]|uniref:Gamma-glutamylcyclotransferase n=1 Tax=Salinarimonas soli TaxID=1638099 RepID=A0A5B2VF74_9HYPH|nr:gamma-glutamylcyclotransferase [Salinarimonas soli]KAA2238213.1 gamma-glutamylcyclotransferase [Salinarimonas soli]
MPLYFAYGANMDRAAMRARCPASKPLGPARLVRHRFMIMSEGYATVARDPRRAVWGLLWDLALADMPALDRFESLHTGLYAKLVQPVLTESGPRKAVLYIARSHQPGPPRPGYMEGVLAAAREIGLPAEYLRELGVYAGETGGDAPRPKVRPTQAAPGSTVRLTRG